MKNSLSIIVLTHNDELRIVDCLENLRFGDELIVIDDESSDRTVEIVKQYTKNVYIKSMSGNFSNQRNYGIDKAKSEWILFVDSDEIVPEKLEDEIFQSIKNNNTNGYFIHRFDYMWGKKITHGEVGSIKLLRLARAGKGKWHGKVHEKWSVYGKIDELESPLIHVPHQSVREFIKDIDQYSTLRSEELYVQKKNVGIFSIIFYPLGKFLVNYLLKKGYKDKMPGLIYTITMSFHSFMVRSKLFLKNNGS